MHTGHFELTIGAYRITWDRGRPYFPDRERQPVPLVEEIALRGADENVGVLSVTDATGGAPFLVIEHGYILPWTENTLWLGALLVPETHVLFVGVHEDVLAYDLTQPARLWVDTADTGFHHWRRYGDVVTMSAELELAAWNIEGRKLWSTFVEPPYEYSIANDTVYLTVLDVPCTFPLRDGPSWGTTLPWVGR